MAIALVNVLVLAVYPALGPGTFLVPPNPPKIRWQLHNGQPRAWNVTDAAELVPFDEDSYYQDPLGFFARLRESRPVAQVRMLDYGRVWVITRYADVRAALTDSRLANKIHGWPGGGPPLPDETPGVHALLNIDPPDHTRLRRLVQKAFTARRAVAAAHEGDRRGPAG
jgi:cytochrome P450